MAALAATIRKLIHIAYGVIRSGKAFDPLTLNFISWHSAPTAYLDVQSCHTSLAAKKEWGLSPIVTEAYDPSYCKGAMRKGFSPATASSPVCVQLVLMNFDAVQGLTSFPACPQWHCRLDSISDTPALRQEVTFAS